MRKVDAPVFQILRRHHDDGRASNRAGWANDAIADGPEHSRFWNVQNDCHDADVGASTRTKRTIRLLILPAGLVELSGDPLVDIPVFGEGDVFDEGIPSLREDVLQRAFPKWRG